VIRIKRKQGTTYNYYVDAIFEFKASFQHSYWTNMMMLPPEVYDNKVTNPNIRYPECMIIVDLHFPIHGDWKNKLMQPYNVFKKEAHFFVGMSPP